MNKLIYGGIGVLAAGVGTLALLASAASPVASASQNPIKTSVTVFGTSTVTVTPTKAQVMLGVSNQDSSAQAALASNNQTMNQVIAAVEKLGIPKTAISTGGLGINPVYNQANPPAVTAYQVSDNLTINTTIALSGKVIDHAVAAGANQVNGINFTTPTNTAYEKSYHAALKNARTQALAVASGLDEHLLGTKTVTVETGATQVPQPYFALASAASNTPVLPGQQQESVTLKVVYQLGH